MHKKIKVDTKIETRYSAEPAKVENKHIIGMACSFGTYTEDMGGWREVLDPTCFDESLESNREVKAFVEHNMEKPLGSLTEQSLTITKDEKGLFVDINPTPTSYANDLLINMEHNVLNKMSIGFYCTEDRWDKVDGELVRTIVKGDIFDISVVAFPANNNTECALRSLTAYEQNQSRTNKKILWMRLNSL